MSNTCIRVLADPVQIKQCKEELQQLESPLNVLTRMFNLAGNATRFKILYLLHREGKMCPCDLSDILEISVGGISQHLRKLKDGGIIRDKKVGQTVFYSIVEENAQIIKPVLKSLSREKETVS
ncbi:metalloregulator ArsR/SmtB family transcription factor [Fulvivirgaceae bacterium BMA10]|uniref:Metalloregulator ArsR/SmtB family transcription factor n=1 Tax=Splendidivirga corallicola TaxID=3051826 RepID=A0ABT8KPQ1_9BACT|nr:metalloregulator ArsR/SmtB family transcription factor [Fulvivirgaceae bacterium BMA10]